MAVAKQQSEAWRKALDGVPDSLRMLLEINNTENVTAMEKTKILLGFNIFFFFFYKLRHDETSFQLYRSYAASSRLNFGKKPKKEREIPAPQENVFIFLFVTIFSIFLLYNKKRFFQLMVFYL